MPDCHCLVFHPLHPPCGNGCLRNISSCKIRKLLALHGLSLMVGREICRKGRARAGLRAVKSMQLHGCNDNMVLLVGCFSKLKLLSYFPNTRLGYYDVTARLILLVICLVILLLLPICCMIFAICCLLFYYLFFVIFHFLFASVTSFFVLCFMLFDIFL